MITLDPISYKVQINSVTLELQPLTFELFARLFDHAGQILSIDQRIDFFSLNKLVKEIIDNSI